MLRIAFWLWVALLWLPVWVSAQPAPTFSDYFGFEAGDRYVRPHEVDQFCRRLAEQFPTQVQRLEYGRTYEDRPLQVLIVSARSNMAQLETLRQNHLRRLGLGDGTAPTAEAPAVVWLSFGIHGDEASSPDAAMKLLYDLLVPGNGAQVEALLQHTVLLLDPCVNPDGRSRYLQYHTTHAGMAPNANPLAWEHEQGWPSGRVNHYLYDLNRDWAWQTQVESQARGVLYQLWLPHVHADYHEMAPESEYYFLPAAKPYHRAITDWQRRFQEQLGAEHRKDFDANGWRYYSREVFDLLYPSYGDSWPLFQGAIGMTYEQAGGVGLAYDQRSGYRLTLKDRLTHHYTTAMGILRLVARTHKQLIEEQVRFYQRADQAPQGAYAAYAIERTNDPLVLQQLIRLLDHHQIRYGFLKDPLVGLGFDYSQAAEGKVTAGAGALLVPVQQPKGTLVRVLFEPNTDLEDSLTYDLTAWSLPYAFGLRAVAFKTLPAVRLDPSPVAPAAAPMPSAWGFVLPSSGPSTAHDAAALLKLGARPYLLTRPTVLDGKRFEAGSLVVQERDSTLQRQAFSAVRWQAVPIATSEVSEGLDIGSDYTPRLSAPRIAVLAGPEIATNTLGDVWHLFEQELHYPITLLATDNANRVPWEQFDVLILAGGRPKNAFTDAGYQRLEDWIRRGGRVVALEGALGLFADRKGYNLKTRVEEEEDTPAPNRTPYAEQARKDLSAYAPGAVLTVAIDTTHPLAFGLGPAFRTLLTRSTTYELLADGGNVGVLEQGTPLAGFVGADLQTDLTESLAFGEELVGRGRIVYLPDNPLFRGFWLGGRRLFLNAVFYSGY